VADFNHPAELPLHTRRDLSPLVVTRPMRISLTASAALVIGASACAHAHLSGSIAPPSAAQCRAAIDTLTTGNAADLDEQGAATALVASCGREAVQAYATALRRQRTSASTEALDPVFATPVLDSAVFNAALELASDGTATLGPRVLALGVLLQHVVRSDQPGSSSLASIAEGDVCAVATVALGRPPQGNLPADALELVRHAARGIERNASEPLAVRSAANCVMNAWRSVRRLPMQALHPATTYGFSLHGVCGRTFGLRSTSPVTFDLEVRVDGAGDVLPLVSRARASGESSAEVRFVAPGTGAVEILLDGEGVARAGPSATACP